LSKPSGSHGTPAIYTSRFTAVPVDGSNTILTFFGWAAPGFNTSVELVPACSVSLSVHDLLALRDVLTKVLSTFQTLAADTSNPQ
jgi:hypothetical protein